MSRPITVSIPHTLGKDEAIRRLKAGFARLSSGAPLKIEEETWNDDQLTFKISALGQAAAGTANVTDDTVRIDVVLPWFMQKLAEAVQSSIASRARILLEKK
jgi:hypothetical protein